LGIQPIRQGIEDLKFGVVRTPLEPKTTFEDDPLRVLRCVRFASRLGFQTVPEISGAAKEASIQVRRPSYYYLVRSLTIPQSMLATKISRERVGDEVDKMIRGTHLEIFNRPFAACSDVGILRG
jgi:tRNA nucleotidyltransferase (CCA-adding enzyme)